jgi:hypothetical protein
VDKGRYEELVLWAERRARDLYAGERVKHRSCGIAMAETFGRPHQAYQALRRGGLTGCGFCGSIKAGELILGEVFGDPDPAGPTTETLRRAIVRYRQLLEDAEQAPRDVLASTCNELTARFGEFRSPERHQFCTGIASLAARCLAQAILDCGGTIEPYELELDS